jgi:predicted unusual protein kinase regulating ubiquinone biosynthesis (AarF/ABC1/UbiB family)
VLQDSNPGVPFKEVERLFREEFGVPWQQLFQSIEVR